MAQQVRVEMVDDIDGSEASQTVPFSLDGVSYEIDLSEDNAVNLREELAPYVAAARRIGGRKSGPSASRSSDPARRERNREIRAWAQDNGYDLAERGRLASEVIEAFEAAQREAAEESAKPARKRAPRKRAAKKDSAA
ncbi:histone-like nucleoid-structuring protein Lsr2 [Amycolatopsis sp. CA-230715]|uniref:histone-like nucleoid-structuring protein Lsr2 n=1 Tax=Amycolatopsis sp. CA-230715 TaxID=2745196 RepID=UPI001C027F3A|nr:Lsr2 family protein [Amycolatopsis sp. CA-230715]QWF84637.1 Nucleoid-associated protein Lsr2 [Amycolatopsis sp. CA-230715]